MRRRISAAAVAVVLGGLSALGGGPARAGENDVFGVTPHPARVEGAVRTSLHVPLDADGPVRDAVRVYNRTDAPVRLAVYAAEAIRGSDGTLTVGFPGERPDGLASAINLGTRELELSPRGEVIVPFSFDPVDVPPEPGMGAIVVALDTSGEGTLDIVQRIALLVRPAEPGDPVVATAVEPERGSAWLRALAVIAGAVSVALLLLLRRRRRDSDEPPDQVPDEDGAREPHQRVHSTPTAP